MSEKLDKLFRDNLESHSIHPRPELWERVEAGLGQKREKKAIWIYYSVAAALLFLFALTVWLRWGVQSEMPNEMTLPVTNAEQKNELPKESNTPEEDNELRIENEETPVSPRRMEMAETSTNGERKLFEANEEPVEVEWRTPILPRTEIAFQQPNVMGDRKPVDESISLLPEDMNGDTIEEAGKREIRRYAEAQIKNFLVGEPLESPKGVIKMPEINIPFEKLLAGK